MAKTIYPILISFLFLTMCADTFGQNEKQKLQTIMRQYQKQEVLSMDIVAFGFSNPSDKKGKKVMSGSLCLDHDKYYSKTNEVEMIVNGEEMTVVDHAAKSMVIGKSKPIQTLKKEQPIFSLDSILAKGGNVTYKGKISGIDVYKVELLYSWVTSVEFHINAQGLLSRMVYYYKSVPDFESEFYKMDVQFSNISLSAPPGNTFSAKKFIASKKSKLPASAYKEYSVNEVDYSQYQGALSGK